ncbi:MAG: hypothetical protein HY901_08750 [Deltaproteobacteria bacterium]|nr:hypothetical protein [Deltaproteobacteria bacterium]
MTIGSRLPSVRAGYPAAAKPSPRVVDFSKVPETIQVNGKEARLSVSFGSDGNPKSDPFFVSLDTKSGRVPAKVVSLVAYQPLKVDNAVDLAKGTEAFRLSAKSLKQLEHQDTIRVSKDLPGIQQFNDWVFVVAEVIPPGAKKPVKIVGTACYDDEL